MHIAAVGSRGTDERAQKLQECFLLLAKVRPELLKVRVRFNRLSSGAVAHLEHFVLQQARRDGKTPQDLCNQYSLIAIEDIETNGSQ